MFVSYETNRQFNRNIGQVLDMVKTGEISVDQAQSVLVRALNTLDQDSAEKFNNSINTSLVTKMGVELVGAGIAALGRLFQKK